MLARSHLALVAVFLFAATGRSQTTWYVDVNGTPPGNGTAGNPYTSLQYAISQATTLDGDTVLVLPGTYFENVDFLGKALAVVGQSGAASTILDGGGGGSVVSIVGVGGPQAALDGFTVRGGRGTGSYPDVKGGGIYCVSASPLLVNLVVEDNEAVRGAGVYLENSAAQLSLCTIRGNRATPTLETPIMYGTGIYAACGSTPHISDCTIEQNVDAGHGGGVFGAGTYVNCVIQGNRGYEGGGAYSGGCDLQMLDCLISGNFAVARTGEVGFGGGVYGPARLIRCTIQSNLAGVFGGGVFGGFAGNTTLNDCTVSGNLLLTVGSQSAMGGGTAYCNVRRSAVYGNRAGSDSHTGPGAGRGGGVFAGTATDCDIHDNLATSDFPDFTTSFGGGISETVAVRCTIYRNTAMRGGGAHNSSLTHCTLYANAASETGGGLHVDGANNTVSNSILWNDVPQEITVSTGTAAVSYSDVRGGAAGTGNLNLDPRLWAPMSGDLHLKPQSPCIDAGDPASPNDPDGSRADMGAIPFVPGWCGEPGAYCLAKVNSLGCSPAIGFSGSPAISGPDDFHVVASDELNRKNGFLFWSRGHRLPPFDPGQVCLQGQIERTLIQNSGGSLPPTQDCSGTYDFHFSHAYFAAHGIAATDTIYAQWFSRDPMHPDGTARNYSDALEFTVCP